MSLKKTLKDIKSLKIQGAENVAKEAVKALGYALHHSKTHTTEALIYGLFNAKKRLFETRPTEPCMRNALNYVLLDVFSQDPHTLVSCLDERIKNTLNHFKVAKENIISYGAAKIPNNSVVFTHCHSQTVIDILIKAKKDGKKFEVHNTETRPLFQGRKTAEQLAKAGIKVKHFIDSAARFAIKKTDICLFGTDAITTIKIFNKIGTELFCEVAKGYGVPVYFCTNSWKFDPLSVYGVEEKIENRNKNEVWKNSPKKVVVCNPAFEQIDPRICTGVISELGVFNHTVFVDEVRRKHKWMR